MELIIQRKLHIAKETHPCLKINFNDFKIIICGIYKITSPSKKIYIGQSININQRWYHYKKYQGKGQSRLYNSFQKYGIRNHKFEILQICLPVQLNDLEIYYINLYQSFNTEFGLNLKDGGNVCKFSDETKKKIGLASGKARKGIIFTDKHKQNMSKSKIGNKYNLGKPFTEERKKNMRHKHKPMPKGVKREGKKIIDIKTNIIYNSINEASIILKIKYTTLAAMLRGQNKNKTNLIYLSK